ncbi:MAG: squalene/phytoene synthase family protein [Candidatus Bilamarchaeaceae archaeon]
MKANAGPFIGADREFCWRILPRVSRSFAFCIRMFPKPINEEIMVAYLLYRVIDTVEDCSASVETKKEMFGKVMLSIAPREYNEKLVKECGRELAEKIDATYEKELMENYEKVVRVYYAQPGKIRRSIFRWGKVMADGMYEFLNRRIYTIDDQNKYSYYVAGVVGYLINDVLYYNNVISARLRKRLRVHARRFGLALQKVNILRDIAKDLRGGRRYWPEKIIRKYSLSYETICLPENRQLALKVLREQIKDAMKYLHSAIYYIISLPKNAVRVRIACAIPLFMAIESFAKCYGNEEVF